MKNDFITTNRFMVQFCIIMLIALILIIAVWNQVTDFKTAYIQSVIFLIIMNWFDGIVVFIGKL